jgi:hypothetical protein
MKNFPSRRILRANNFPAKNYPSEELSERRTIRAKNSPAKNHPGEECSGEEYTALAKNNFSEELSDEESSERRTFR